MSYDPEFDPERGILCIRTRGKLSVETYADSGVFITELARKYGCCKFLFDHRKASLESHTDAYYLTGVAEQEGFTQLLNWAAILHLPEDVEMFRFLETTGLNRGINTKSFTDEAEAIAWLVSCPGTPPDPPDA